MTRSLLFVLLLPLGAHAQDGAPVRSVPQQLPAGMTLPIRLAQEIHAGRSKPGTPIHGLLTQRVPFTPLLYFKPGTEILGVVVGSSAATAGSPASLTLRFHGLVVSGKSVSFASRAVALANFVAVSDAAVPCAGAVDRANPSAANWTTCQVGGEQVVRSGWSGPLLNQATRQVGFADYHGVYRTPSLPGEVPDALGVFSSSAAGTYGFGPDATLKNSAGTFTLTSPGRLVLHDGDHLLLQVDAAASIAAQSSLPR